MKYIVYLLAFLMVSVIALAFIYQGQIKKVEGFENRFIEPDEVENTRTETVYSVFELPQSYELKKILHDYLEKQNNCHVDNNPFYYRLFTKSIKNYVEYNLKKKLGSIPSEDTLKQIDSNEYGVYKRLLMNLPPCEELVEKYMSIQHNEKRKKKNVSTTELVDQIKQKPKQTFPEDVLPLRQSKQAEIIKGIRAPVKNLQAMFAIKDKENYKIEPSNSRILDRNLL